MSLRLLSTALLMLAGAATAFGAKPPDLPQTISDDCCEQSYQPVGEDECCETPCPNTVENCPSSFVDPTGSKAHCACSKHTSTACSKCVSSCMIGCMMDSLLPGLGLCEMCPVVRGKMTEMVHPCMKTAVSNCKQMLTHTAKTGCSACKENACHQSGCRTNECSKGECEDCCEKDCQMKDCQKGCQQDGCHESCETGCYGTACPQQGCHQVSTDPCGECCKGKCECEDGCKCQEKKKTVSKADPCGECCKGKCKCEDGCKCQEEKKTVGQVIQNLIGTGCPMKMQVTVVIEQCPACAMGSCGSEGCCGWVGGWVFKAMMRKPEKLIVKPQEEKTDTDSHANRSVCPYLQEQAAKQHVPQAEKPVMVGSVLENMEKLIQARRMFMKAERCRHVGELEKAEACYEQAEKLCPGSRFETMSKSRLHTMHAKAHAKSHGEEAEIFQRKSPLPCETCKDQVEESSATKDMKVSFLELLEKARCCIEAGNVADAQKYALEAANLKTEASDDTDTPMGQAKKMMESGCFSEAKAVLTELYSADCTSCQVADMLSEIERVDMGKDSAAQVAELLEAAQRAYTDGCMEDAANMVNEALTLDPACGSAMYLKVMISQKRVEKGDVEQAEPPASYEQPYGMQLNPTLPPLDPKIVDALEKFGESVEGTDSKNDDGKVTDVQGDAEGQDDPETDATPTQDDPLSLGLANSLRNLVNELKQQNYIETDGKGRALVEMQLGGLEFQMNWNAWDSHFTVHYFDNESTNGELSDIDDSETCDEPLYYLETELDSEATHA